ncbi:MAG TPA: ABC transporter ATP-binding protein [Anaerolineaceae bacterium]|nr:ABC transporter ATP-binding protein [Anaerolineaceae bacterium]HPS33512.1 ABC transporter ATP-binding protein [Anaerolineaceae bacterium]
MKGDHKPTPYPSGSKQQTENANGHFSIKNFFKALRNASNAFKLVWAASKPNAVFNFGLTPIAALMPAGQAWVGKLIVDKILGVVNAGTGWQAGLREVLPVVLLELVLVLVSAVVSQARLLSNRMMSLQLTTHVNTLIIQKAISLDLQFFEDPVFYDVLQNARRQSDSAALSIVTSTMQIAQQTITLVSLIALLVRFSPFLALIVFAAAIPSFLSDTQYAEMSYRMIYKRAPEMRLLSYLEMLLTGSETFKEIKLFGLGQPLLERFKALFIRFFNEDMTVARKRTLAGLAWGVLSSLVYYGSYVWVIYRTIIQAVTLGDMTMFLSIFRQSQNSISSLLDNFNSIYENNLYLDNLLNYLKITPALSNPAEGVAAPVTIKEGIEFRHVSFKYPGSDKFVLKDVNLFIPPGESIALVGLNGAGKTTLVKLLTRLYDPTEGAILLDGRDLREYDLNSLYQRFGVIFQDYARYQFSVRENIGFGQIDEVDNLEKVREAAERGGADKVVEELPDGYETILGRRWEKGLELSGGQWQKIALARAFMRDAEVMILDEPTSALDAEAEYEIYKRFRELMHGRIAVLISHRFSTVRMADRIVVLSEGRVLEVGSHAELMQSGGPYAHLFNLQAEGYR